MRPSVLCFLVGVIGVSAQSTAPPNYMPIPARAAFGEAAVDINLAQVSHRIYEAEELQLDDVANEVSSVSAAVLGHYDLRQPTANDSQIVPRCGNGVRDENEECDDGNAKDGDGCGKSCKVEGGFACSGKSITNIQGSCRQCKKEECTINYNGAWECLSTKARMEKGTEVTSVFARAPSGFCECDSSMCMMGSICVRPREGEHSDGFTRDSDGKCECGPGSCRIPLEATDSLSPFSHSCVKVTKALVRNETSGLCQCAAAVPAVSSSDPSEARMGSAAACKAYPTKPTEKIRGFPPRFATFECMRTPYKSSSGETCDSCEAGSCKQVRDTGANNVPAFSCFDNETMRSLDFERAADGSCKCTASSCLAPSGDGMKCVPLEGSSPYGAVKTSEGKCGCAESPNVCLMPTLLDAKGVATHWQCLDLGDQGNRTEYGEKFARDDKGKCTCKSSYCQKSTGPTSVGVFDCLDTKKEATYSVAEDGTCECRSECRFTVGSNTTKACAACPRRAGDCVSRCSQPMGAANKTVCEKYCVTKHMKFQNPAGVSKAVPLDHRDKDARVIECRIQKSATCELNANRTNWVCTQTTKGTVKYNCPGRWSQHANRVLPDGSLTHGFKSVCEPDDLECQIQKCDRTSDSAICLDKMMLS